MENENTNDHDILIKINTQVGRLIDDVKALNDNMSGKIENLEACKADKAEIVLLHGTTLKRLETLDEKVEGLEQWRYYVAGGLVIVMFIVDFLMKKYG